MAQSERRQINPSASSAELADRPRSLSPPDSFASLKPLKRCATLSEAVAASRRQFVHPRLRAHGLGESADGG